MRWLVPGLLSVALLAIDLAAQTLPPPFPRPGATQLLDNERVTVWDVVWPKGQPTARHRHPYALAGVYLEPGDRVITAPAKGETNDQTPLFHVRSGRAICRLRSGANKREQTDYPG